MRINKKALEQKRYRVLMQVSQSDYLLGCGVYLK
jgi:hypothetical protein